MKFSMVEQLKIKEDINIGLSCKTLEVSRSGYYDWKDRPESERSLSNMSLLIRIKALHKESKQTYGSPRITEKLRSEGESCSRNRVAKIMRINKIASESVKKFKIATTTSNHDLPIAPREFETENADSVMAPNQVWTGDITYIHTDEGWLFLAVFLDIFTRKIVGFSSDNKMETDLILNALAMALGRQSINNGELISHTDRGSQYASDKYRKMLALYGIIDSMSRKGNCYDNAHVESFFHSLKTELVYRRKFKTREEAKQEIFEWIETWYNKKRLHSSLNYMTPEEYEKTALAA